MTLDTRAVFVDHLAAEFAAQGFPLMPARVLIALTASDEGCLSSEELRDQLRVSAAAISGAVRYLQTIGFVLRAPAPGSRRHMYRLPGTSSWYTATLNRADGMQRLVSVLREGLTAIPAESGAHPRIAEMVEFFEFLELRMPELLVEWDALRRKRT